MPSRDLFHEKAGLSRIGPAVRKVLRESVRLTPKGCGEDAGTRFGGRPNLPTKYKWPMWEGEPLAFIAQIDLGTLHVPAGLELPHKGALFFFYEGGQKSWGFRPKDGRSCRVLYSPDSLGQFSLRALPEDLDEERVYKATRLTTETPEVTVPNIQDAAITKMALTVEERIAYVAFYRSWTEALPKILHRIGGFPDCVQGDPKVRAQLTAHGIDCSNTAGYEEGKRRGLLAGASEWELLLQVDSEPESEMMWRDRGRIYFLLRRDDLAQRRFDGTRIVLQSR